MSQALPRKDPDLYLRLIQPTAVSGCVVDREAIPNFGGHFRAKDIRQRFAAMEFRIVQSRWIVAASEYAIARLTATRANSKPERSGVGKVKWRPAFGSTAQKTLAVPRRSYSLSRRASRPGTPA